MTTPDTRMPVAANALLEEIQSLAIRRFGRLPAVVCTDRRGRFEGGWARRNEGGDLYVLGHRSGLGLTEKQRQAQNLSTLIRNYAKHPQAEAKRIVRTEGWPDCIELDLT